MPVRVEASDAGLEADETVRLIVLRGEGTDLRGLAGLAGQAAGWYLLMSPPQVVVRWIGGPMPITDASASSVGARWASPRWGRCSL